MLYVADVAYEDFLSVFPLQFLVDGFQTAESADVAIVVLTRLR